jgi:hypothetical protein
MKKLILLFAFMALLLFACREKSKVDVLAPTISRVAVDGEDSTVIILTAGENITISIDMLDNMGLNEVQFNIHPAEDGHVHDGDGHAGGEERLNTGSWFADGRADVSGTSANKEFELSVPDSIAGNWHLAVNLLDEVGERATEKVLLIRVVNANLPSLSVQTNPALNADGNVNLAEGSNLIVNGLAEDNDGLTFLHVFVTNAFGDADDTTNITIAGNAIAQAFSNLSFDNFPEGEYRLIVEAGDSLGYERKWDALIFVEE